MNPKPIPLLSPADYQAGSQDADSVNMGLLHKIWIFIMLGAIAGNDCTIKLYSGTTAGTKTTELPFKYQLTTVDLPAASADILGARTSVAIGSSGLIFTDSGDFNLRTIMIEFMSDQMTDGEEWLTVETDDGAASVMLMSINAIGWARHATLTGAPTAL